MGSSREPKKSNLSHPKYSKRKFLPKNARLSRAFLIYYSTVRDHIRCSRTDDSGKSSSRPTIRLSRPRIFRLQSPRIPNMSEHNGNREVSSETGIRGKTGSKKEKTSLPSQTTAFSCRKIDARPANSRKALSILGSLTPTADFLATSRQ